jgi:hypothetical protein
MDPAVESELVAKIAQLQAEVAELRAALATMQALLIELVEQSKNGKPPHIASTHSSSTDGAGYRADAQQHYGSEQSAELQQWLALKQPSAKRTASDGHSAAGASSPE